MIATTITIKIDGYGIFFVDNNMLNSYILLDKRKGREGYCSNNGTAEKRASNRTIHNNLLEKRTHQFSNFMKQIFSSNENNHSSVPILGRLKTCIICNPR